VDLEGTEDGSGGYNDFSDESLGEDTANVSDFEDGNPKDAPHVCLFEKDACRKIFQLRGDAKQGMERVCGGSAATCIRNGHRDEARPVGPPGIYEVITTARKVDGILSTHQTKEAFVKTRAEAKTVRDAHLSILANSPSYVDVLTGASKERETKGGEAGDADTFAGLQAWDDIDDAPDDEEGKPPALKLMKPKTRSAVRKLKTTPAPKSEADMVTTQALLDVVLLLKAKVDALEGWTTVEAKKEKRGKGRLSKERASSSESSEGEETDGTATAGLKPKDHRKGKSRASTQRKGRPKVDVSEDSCDTSYDSSPKDQHRGLSSKAPVKGKPTTPNRSEAELKRGAKLKFYGVARGYSPGVYKTWGEAERQVEGFRVRLIGNFTVENP
jgi:hypothetical protein